METKALPTATKAMKQIETQALESSAEDRFVRTIEIGQHVRQGDVYIERVKDDHAKGAKTKDHQLADGSTQGSRHVADSSVEVFLPTGGLSVLEGPVILAPERWTLAHPQHSDVSFPSGTYRTCFPRDYDQEELARVRD